MSVRATERRRKDRTAAAHPVAICDPRGQLLVRGRTSDVSETGLYCLTEARRALRIRGRVIVEVSLPAGRSPRLRHRRMRKIRYLGKVLRVDEIGQLVGLALELVEKL